MKITTPIWLFYFWICAKNYGKVLRATKEKKIRRNWFVVAETATPDSIPTTYCEANLLRRHLQNEDQDHLSWEDLSRAIPTLGAFARICGRAFTAETECEPSDFSKEAQTILFWAKDRGVLEIKQTQDEYDAVDRFLTVFVERSSQQMIGFKNNQEPEKTIRFVEGFRELCRKGLVMHHAQRDFSLTQRGFEVAKEIAENPMPEWECSTEK